MTKVIWLFSTGAIALATPAMAQDSPASPPSAAEAAAPESNAQGDIIVTATRRSQALSDVPLAVSAVTAETLQNSGATDIRQLNQLSPSLLVSSTTSEAGAGVARIRGIGTVGDNPGLESSVATFIDGVYRSRTGSGLTELGAIDRIEVLRGPQGTLFGRNASAGLIHVITAKPKFESEGTAEATYGNYDYMRGVVGLTGPISEHLAYRIDGVYVKRDGFLKDVVSGRDVNNRDRWLVRGQLLFEPTDQFSVRIIGDYTDRNEECCGAVYLPASDARLVAGTMTFGPSAVAGLIRALSGRADAVNDDPSLRQTAITPGRSYRSDVRDWGLSGEINYEMGLGKLTSITAYRDNRYIRGQDADFNALDLFIRPDNGDYQQRFKTFTQELRLQGEAFEGKLDWLVGGYYADEKLSLDDNLQYGPQYGLFYSCLVASQIPIPSPGAALSPTSPGCLTPTARGAIAGGAFGAASAPILASLDRLSGINGTGAGIDRYRQSSRNYALFTHNVFNITDRLSLTAGIRYTNERKKLSAQFNGSPGDFAACAANAAALNPFLNAPGVAPLAQAIFSFSCLPLAPVPVGTSLSDTKKEDEFTGTAVISFKPTDELMTYASYSKGYKAGGFNLDRSPLGAPFLGGQTLSGRMLRFEPEKVDAFEIGAKFNGRGFDLNVAAFYQLFDDFQLNAFTGTSFVVVNIAGCSELSGGSGGDSDNVDATGACTGKSKAGVVSKGVEIEAFLRPAPYFSANLGFTLADTKYRHNLTAVNGTPLQPSFFQLPGHRLSNSSLYTVTGSAGWTPPIGGSGLSGLIYADFRYQSDINTGSDLDQEKRQDGVMVVNARIGLRGADQRWGIEFWAQNVFDVDYTQVAFDAPVQPGGRFNTIEGVRRGFQTTRNQLFGAFMAEPRTYGVTVRTKF